MDSTDKMLEEMAAKPLALLNRDTATSPHTFTNDEIFVIWTALAIAAETFLTPEAQDSIGHMYANQNWARAIDHIYRKITPEGMFPVGMDFDPRKQD